MENGKKMKVSVVIPVFNSSKSLKILVNRIIQVKSVGEVILINDGSSNLVSDVCFELVNKFKKVNYIEFYKNFGQLAAINAGFANAKFPCTVVMDDDLQHSPEDIDKLTQALDKGYDFVFGVSKVRKTKSKIRWILSSFNSKIMQWSFDLPKEIKVTSFYALKTDLAKLIANYEGPFPYISGRLLSITKNGTNVEVNFNPRFNGKSNYNLMKLIELGLRGLFNYTIKPLRIVFIVGVIISMLNFSYSIYLIGVYFSNGNAPSGWTSIVVVVLFTSGVQMIFMGIIGEYIGRSFLTLNKIPQYAIKRKSN